MEVFLLETGCYDSKDIVGVYATLEAAQAAGKPKKPSFRDDKDLALSVELWKWNTEDGETWRSNGDWDDAAKISKMVVQE
jgi:hypothetical protein